jgi:murein L,D-transpeptidase YcbB/YkuD
LGLNYILKFNFADYQKALSDLLSSRDTIIYINNSAIGYYDTLKSFYAINEFHPHFIKSFESNDFIDTLTNILNNAYENGLNPETYHRTQIIREFSEAIKDSAIDLLRYVHLARTELLICDGILKYAYHMRYGVINPKEIFLDSYYLPIADSSQRILFEPLKQSNIFQYLYKILPKSMKYKKLQAALKLYESFEKLPWEKIPIPSERIVIGSKDPSVNQIVDRLATLGFIDTSKYKIIDDMYDSLLVEPIKIFQKTNGLNDDGVISKTTVDKLNIPPKEYVKKIKINLERFRWIDYSDTARYIVVNIPDFKLHVMENGKESFDIKVCAGRKRTAYFEKQYLYYLQNKKKVIKPEDWETPYMYGQILNIILNPTWSVPQSIMREEIVNKIRKDSTYLNRANFRVYKQGKPISQAEINLNDFSNENIPYSIIQDPGPGNALGKIKFMFDNPFGIYLHDTPSRRPFSYNNRAVSHGCVRVEKPLPLAEYLLNKNSKWNINYLKIEIGSKVNNNKVIEDYRKKRNELRKNASIGLTTDIKLDNYIPLFIDYYTAWVDENGLVNFRDDVYNHDKIVWEHLLSKSSPK